MPALREDLRHDLAALYAFIDSITSEIGSKRSFAAYGPAADSFFEFVSGLADRCKDYISGWSVADPEEFEDRRGELSTLRAAWQELHVLVKPTLDADTLQAPLAVVDGLVRRFQEVPACAGTTFAIFHTSDFNYAEVRTTSLRPIIEKFANIIPSPPSFPPNLGLIGMPYSQGRTAFANCLVAHEMGHYLYTRLPLQKELKSRIDSAVQAFPNSEEKKSEYRDVIVQKLTIWAEELFCDLFAVRLAGPCYTYAYIEAFDLCVILDWDGKLSDDRLLGRLEFYDKYPSHIYRLQQQAIFLRESPWWDHISNARQGKSPSRSASLLAQVIPITPELHVKSNPRHGRLISVLDPVLSHVRETLGKVFNGVDDEFASFSQLNIHIHNYLAAGIVPSTINMRLGVGKDDTYIAPASPVVLLNSGMDFYLNHMPDLITSIPGEDLSSFERRLHWLRRLEEWIAKALEDQSLEGEAGSVDSGALGN